MPIPDPTARLNAIRALVGPDRAAHMPDDYTVHLFDDNPDGDGVELADTTVTEAFPAGQANGYAAGTLSADDFTFDGEIATGWADFPAPLAEYADTARWFVMRSGGLDYFTSPLLEALDVTGASAAYTLGCSLFFDSSVEPPA